ncbi:pyridoxal phosphate-dependent aminotransferase [Pelagibacterium limicola]|uniref:pyridoxal phosphate-dependent aminotransferase n=1 Tax=Pelagibacterium limicola TaxID=2791022 RepID=UPI0018AFADA4
MTRPRFTPVIEALPSTVPFLAPEAIVRQTGIPMRARLGANESGFGPSPRVTAAIAQAASGVWTYGDPENHDLRTALAAKLGRGIDEISIGEGIDSLQGLICRLFIEPGDRVVTSLGAYPTFNYHVAAQGGALVTVPYRDDREDLEALADETKKAPTRIVYLANPDNPMGTWWQSQAIEAFVDAVSAKTLVVLDEAYGETAPTGTMPPTSFIRPNLLRLRTFSKAYGLAGLRVGYCLGDPGIIAGFDRIRNHFGVNKIGQIAALAALDDTAYLQEVLDAIARARRTIESFSSELGLLAIPSATNFVAIDCGQDAAYAQAVLDGLAARGVFVRKPSAPVLARTIRMSVGPEAELEIAHQALAETIRALERR